MIYKTSDQYPTDPDIKPGDMIYLGDDGIIHRALPGMSIEGFALKDGRILYHGVIRVRHLRWYERLWERLWRWTK